MHLEHAELALDDLRARPRLGGLHGDIHELEDLIARRNLDVERGHALGGQVALRNSADECGVLGLHSIEVGVTAQLELVSAIGDPGWEKWDVGCQMSDVRFLVGKLIRENERQDRFASSRSICRASWRLPYSHQ